MNSMLEQVLPLLKEVKVTGILDIVVMAILIYTVLVWFKRARSAAVMTGIIFIAALYLITRQFSMQMTATVLEKFFAVIFIALIVIFQEDLRAFFERVAEWGMHPKGFRRSQLEGDESLKALKMTLFDLARQKIGALVVLRGKDPLERHVQGGMVLDGEMSDSLLQSLFDPNSIGHDGAVILEKSRVAKFAVHLPLSKRLQELGKGGTRHAAALGLSERCDALCLVVSEERGIVSAVRYGKMKVLHDADSLTVVLKDFQKEVHPEKRISPYAHLYRENYLLKLIAGLLAVALWFVLVHGARLTYRTFALPVALAELPEEWQAGEIDPAEVDVTFRGPRSAFYFLKPEDIHIVLSLTMKPGIQPTRIYSKNIDYPKKLTLDHIEPGQVYVTLVKNESIIPEN